MLNIHLEKHEKVDKEETTVNSMKDIPGFF